MYLRLLEFERAVDLIISIVFNSINENIVHQCPILISLVMLIH